MINRNRTLGAILLTSLISACGGGGESAQAPIVPLPALPTPTIYTGVFVDSPVHNLNFTTATQTGRTSVDGEFSYQLNEEVTFSIGGIEFPPVSAVELMTPLSLFEVDDVNDIRVVNTLRLLQSLDQDGDPTNGITITDTVHDLASGLDVDFSSEMFPASVSGLLEMSNAGMTHLIDAVDAIAHFEQTLIDFDLASPSFCPKTHTKIGHSGYFSTLAHGVSGKATIIDDCTIEITEFSYDGGGPDVYFYGAVDHQYSGDNAFALGPQLNGQQYENASITLRLPTGRSLNDLTGLSVWCVDFNANFGEMTFTP